MPNKNSRAPLGAAPVSIADLKTTTSASSATPPRIICAYNYSNDAGRGSETFAIGANASWRGALLGTVAAGAMWMASARPASAVPIGPCTESGPTAGVITITCTGDVPDGYANTQTGGGGESGGTGFAGSPGTYSGGDGGPGDPGFAGVASDSLKLTGGATIGTPALTQAAIALSTTGGNGGAGGAGGTGGAGDKGAGGAGGAGADGGAGGLAGFVEINTSAIINSGSDGIVVTSRGGDGGAGGSGGTGGFGGIYYGYGYAGGNGGNGGNGGTGANGGAITITSSGAITSAYTGISAESRGGNGGNGGAGGVGGEGGGTASAGEGGNGGNGGAGGNGGTVNIQSSAAITTSSGIGINGRSFGGTGGDGGSGGEGGSGGAGGNGGTVTITATANVTAEQNTAIDAESAGGRGGGGGEGSESTGGIGGDGGTVSVTASGDVSATGGHGIRAKSGGGNGGGGRNYGNAGAGGSVTVSSTGTVSATDKGIDAQSKGASIDNSADGFGGNGGNAGDVTVTAKNINSGQTGIYAGSYAGYAGNSGGSQGGGLGGSAGKVTVTVTGDVESGGTGIVASSEGSSGGRSDSGDGGHGGSGGDVNVTLNKTGSIVSYSSGIRAYSRGGRGNSGGEGGLGGDGGNGGNITINTAGDIEVGDTGIWAMSTGGGAGSGAEDGIGGTGGNVTINSSGDIDARFGISALSSGYGGAGDVKVNVTGGTITTAAGSFCCGYGGAVLAISGYGGGRARRRGGGYGPGGDVTVNIGAAAKIDHRSDYTPAIGALSRSGDGTYGSRGSYGTAGLNGIAGEGGPGSDGAAGNNGGAGTAGGAGFNGGKVAVDNRGLIITSGDYASGIAAFSVGGSGGRGGYGGRGGNGGNGGNGGSTFDGVVFSGFDGGRGGDGGNGGNGGAGGNGGNGGAVTVLNSGDIRTSGEESHGIFAGSYGGDGGSGGESGGGGNGGSGGEAGFHMSGSTPPVDGEDGILGDAGNSGTSGNAGGGGAVTVTSSGDITASGLNSHGILAGSGGGYGAGGPVTVNITGGNVSGGSGSGAGVDMESEGGSATLNNAGTLKALSGLAAKAEAGTVTVNNTGKVIGRVDLEGETSATFNNNAGGVFEMDGESKIRIGDSNVPLRALNAPAPSTDGTLNNVAGTVSPGGTGTVKAASLLGRFVQGVKGIFSVDADWSGNAGAGSADKLEVSGTADLNGKVVANAIAFPASNAANKGLTKTFTILTAEGGVTDNGITVGDTAAVDYSLLYPNAKTLNLQAKIDFTPDPVDPEDPTIGGQTSNQNSVGENLNQIVENGGTLGFIPDLLNIPTDEGLNDALDQLTPVGDGAGSASAMATGTTFAQQMLSCRVNGEEVDANRFIREGQCLWARANVRQTTGDGGSNRVGFDETATFFSAGAQLNLGGDWRIGGGIGFEQADLSTTSNAKSEVERLHLGGVLKYNPGPWLFAATVTGGHGWHDNERNVAFGGFSSTATSKTDSGFVSGRLTGAYLMSLGHAYLKPEIDVAVSHFNRDGYRESAGGGIALAVAGSSDTIVSVAPSLELGAEYALPEGGVVRPFIRGGATWVDNDTFITSASFADAGGGVGGFEITSSIDKVVADFAAGMDWIASDGMVLRLQYEGRFGEDTEQHGGNIKLSVPF